MNTQRACWRKLSLR